MKTTKANPPLSPALLVATWFGCGYAPVAPGTAGSAAAVLIAVGLERWCGFVPVHFALLGAALFLPAVWAAKAAEAAFGRKDPGQVVVDEVLGQWIALAGARTLVPESWMAAFLLFRIFDIWKPWPVRRLEKLPGGWGINADDALAGAYAALVLLLAGWFNLY